MHTSTGRLLSIIVGVPILAAVGLSAGLGMRAAEAAAPTIIVSEVWTNAAAPGSDTALFMTIKNAGAADALLRSRCDAAQFAVQQTVDHGEGFPSSRSVKSIPIAANDITRLGADGDHVMLLQTKQALVVGETFSCSITFRDAGTQTIDVTVGKPG